MVLVVLRNTRFIPAVFAFLTLLPPARASEADALAISANIQARHLPFGTILDPVFASPTSNQIVGYTRCGDSALWTGAYLAAEAFRYRVTHSGDALANLRAALAGLKSLADVTADDRLARCIVAADSPFAKGIENEEASNTIHQAPPWIWVDNTSRDQLIGAFFGLGATFDLVDDPSIKTTIGDLVARLTGFVAGHQWSPNDDISNTFLLRPEELQMLIQVTRHVNPADTVNGPFIVPPLGIAVLFDVQSNSSYFKFNLDYMTFYNLLRIQNNGDNRGAYEVVRDYTAPHQNAFFDIIDRALNGPDAARDAETVSLLQQWLRRPRRDPAVDDSKLVPVCGTEACQPIPVPLRPPTDFLWQRDPFQLSGGGNGFIEGAGIDYILPYWMARYFGVISADSPVQSAAAPSNAIAPGSIASLYGINLASVTAQAASQPLPLTLGGVTLSVIDAAGTSRPAPLLYVSAGQINFVVPDAAASGVAKIAVSNASGMQAFSAIIASVTPTLFSADGSGSGAAAATVTTVQVSDSQLQATRPAFECTSSGCSPIPINLGVDTATYLTLYGTGIRNRDSLADVAVTIGGVSVPVQYAGPSPNYAGVDQVNVALPLTLRGSGTVTAVLTVDGQTSNVVTVEFE